MTNQSMKDGINLSEVATNHVLFSSLFLKILDKDKKIVPLHLRPVQKDILKNMTDRTIILKGRQQGVSTLIQSLLYRLAIVRTIAGLVLSYDDKSTQAFRRMFTRFNSYMPEEYRPEFGYNNRTVISFPQTDSEIIVATAGGSGNTGRGFSFSHIHFSEYAFVNDPRPMLSGAIQSGNPKVVLESTANGMDNDFYTKVMEAYHGEGVWKLLFYQWWLSPEYHIPLQEEEELKLDSEEEQLVKERGLTLAQIKWRRYKIKELGRRLFNQEYPESVEVAFLATGVGFFSDIPDLHLRFTAPSNPEFDETHRYIAGLDLGRNRDFTALSVLDLSTGNEVELFRINQVPWNHIYESVVERLKYWDVETLWFEHNNVGNVALENMLDVLDNHPDLKTAIQPINMNRHNKPQLVNYFHTALENQEINLLPIPEAKTEMQNFTATQTPAGNWQYKAEGQAHDDTVMARILANYGRVMGDIKLLEFL